MTPNIQIYQSDDGQVQLDIRLEQETLWLTQAQIAELFHVKPQNITMHLKNIFHENELQEEATCKDFLQVRTEGNREVKRKSKFYNLDAIISVGYRVNSTRATQFRMWATRTLKQHLVQGYTLANSLQEGLPREIELRQKQYEYYRDLLLNFTKHPLPASPFAGGELDALSLPPVKGGLRGGV